MFAVLIMVKNRKNIDQRINESMNLLIKKMNDS